MTFVEHCCTGFGDRLRGIAYILNLCKMHKQQTVYYNDDGPTEKQKMRWSAFPARMTDLISLNGIDFQYKEKINDKHSIHVDYDSGIDLKKDNRPGFKEFHRIQPVSPYVNRRIDEIGVNTQFIGFHVRETDNLTDDNQYFHSKTESKARRNIAMLSMIYRTKKIYLASDNRNSLKTWTTKLTKLGYEVISNQPQYDDSNLRQTSCFDMMVDFFALSRCRRVCRLVPSEFSRFAAWKTGYRLKYRHLK